MLERSRAALAEERARSQTVLLQIAAFEAERETLRQEINSMLSQNTFVFSFFLRRVHRHVSFESHLLVFCSVAAAS
jgi:hypothetical protein